MNFLKNSTLILEKIKSIIAAHSSTEPIEIAVAFWGEGASSILQQNKKFSLICNLRTGGTNPFEIEKVAELPNVSILQNDSLHAKVILSSAGGIVSSANLSANALPFDAIEFQGWHEAGIYVDNSSDEIQKIRAWFSAIQHDSEFISPKDIENAKESWVKRNKAIIVNKKDTADSRQDTKKTFLSTSEKQICSLNEPGGGKDLFLRSAAAVIALNGQGGSPMPMNAFIFLFSGSNGRAFKTHKGKFDINFQSQTVSLKPEYVGYFVGEDGMMETATDKKRRKVPTNTVHALSDWMLNNGKIPGEVKGTPTCETFPI